MRSARLADVAQIHQGGKLGLSGQHFVESGVPAFGAGGLNGYVEQAEYDGPAVILSSIGARCGKCFYVDGQWTSLANTQVILPRADLVDGRYLWHQLNDESSWHRSGTGQPFIKPSDVKARLVRLPELEEQRRVAAILDQADALRATRARALAHLDDLTTSIFHNMFGQLRPSVPLARLVSGFRNGVSPSTSGTVEGRVLTLSAVTRGAFNPSASKPARFATTPGSGARVRAGDFFLCRGNGNLSLVGCGVYVDQDHADLVFPDTVIAATIDEETTNPWYLVSAWAQSDVRSQVAAVAKTTSGIFKINQNSIGQVLVPLPERSDQDAFARHVERIMAMRVQLLTGLGSSERLLASLQAQAFSSSHSSSGSRR